MTAARPGQIAQNWQAFDHVAADSFSAASRGVRRNRWIALMISSGPARMWRSDDLEEPGRTAVSFKPIQRVAIIAGLGGLFAFLLHASRAADPAPAKAETYAEIRIIDTATGRG